MANVSSLADAAGLISTADREVLRRLAEHVATLAARPVEKEKRELWMRHNGLKPTRPVIFCDPENGWNEIITPGDLQCVGEMARSWEFELRKEIYWGDHIKDDRVITGVFEVEHAHTRSGHGVNIVTHGGGDGGAWVYEPPLTDYSKLDNLHFDTIIIDFQKTNAVLDAACSTFDGILPVALKSRWWRWSLGLTREAIALRGLQQLMLDMVDEPEGLHRLMAFLRDNASAELDFLEANGLLCSNADSYVGSGGFGWTDELPEPDADGVVRCKNRWGFAESQETVGVSPKMFNEFILPCQMPLLERFGLNCYGCCEPLDKRWQYVKQIPRLRRVSVSPWADLRKMAEYLQADYVYSLKASPTDLAMPTFHPDDIRSTLRNAFEITRGCRVECIMKDNHTIGKDPKRVTEWVRIAREESERIGAVD